MDPRDFGEEGILKVGDASGLFGSEPEVASKLLKRAWDFEIEPEGDWLNDEFWGPILKALINEGAAKVKPGWLYFIAPAVSDLYTWGPNKNADGFPWEEMEDNYKTFLNAKVRIEHTPGTEFGEVIGAYLDPVTRKIYVLFGFDPTKAPAEVLEKVERGEAFGVSMACVVPFDVCSICGHTAKSPKEYCEHLRVVYRCKACGAEFQSLREAKQHVHIAENPENLEVSTGRLEYFPEKGTLAYMINYKPKWIDLSVVANPAAVDAAVLFLVDFVEGLGVEGSPTIIPLKYVFEERSGKKFPIGGKQ